MKETPYSNSTAIGYRIAGFVMPPMSISLDATTHDIAVAMSIIVM